MLCLVNSYGTVRIAGGEKTVWVEPGMMVDIEVSSDFPMPGFCEQVQSPLEDVDPEIVLTGKGRKKGKNPEIPVKDSGPNPAEQVSKLDDL